MVRGKVFFSFRKKEKAPKKRKGERFSEEKKTFYSFL